MENDWGPPSEYSVRSIVLGPGWFSCFKEFVLVPFVMPTPETRSIMAQVTELRLPEETILFIQGDRNTLKAELIDQKLLDESLKAVVFDCGGPVQCFMESLLSTEIHNETLCIRAEKIKPSFHSHASNLEAQLGYRFTCSLDTTENCTQDSQKLNV